MTCGRSSGPSTACKTRRGRRSCRGWKRGRISRVFQKGTDPAIDSYSGFFDNGRRKATGLGDYLKEKGATDVYVCGLATDYCVKFTALDARALGFETFLIKDASRGVNLKPGDVEAAIEEMRRAGVDVVNSETLLSARSVKTQNHCHR